MSRGVVRQNALRSPAPARPDTPRGNTGRVSFWTYVETPFLQRLTTRPPGRACQTCVAPRGRGRCRRMGRRTDRLIPLAMVGTQDGKHLPKASRSLGDPL